MADRQPDGELVQASLGGDQAAFGTLIERYQCLVCSVAYGVTGNLAQSEDIAQETFLTAWQKLADLQDTAKLKAWLCGIARNLGRNSRKRTLPETAGAADATAVDDANDASPPAVAIRREEESLLWESLEAIPENYREPMILFYRQDQSVRSVAEMLDLSEDAVKQRLSRGRKMLREQLTTFVEETLARSRPGRALTAAILAALPAAAPQAAAAATLATAAKGTVAAKTATGVALSGAVLGPLLGALGAAFGVWSSIRHTKSDRERQFVIKMSVVGVLYVMVFLAVFLPTMFFAARLLAVSPWLLGGVLTAEILLYVAGLVTLIVWGNRRQRQIQKEDGTWVDPKDLMPDPAEPRQGVVGACLGSVFGSLAWVIVLSVQAGDWVTAAAVPLAGGVITILSIHAARRRPQAFWRISIATLTAVIAVMLVAMNLRWHAWLAVLSQDAWFAMGGGTNLAAANGLVLLIYAGLTLLFLGHDRRERKMRRS